MKRQADASTTGDAVVGRRVSVGAHRGTIRYVGSVPPTDGIWLGIEWDDPTRGKHDGVASDGTSYFNVRVPGSGSFLRPTASKLSYGSSFLQALRAKYLSSPSTGDGSAPSKQQHHYSRRNLAEIEIEAPNMHGVIQRTARLDRLRQVGLGGWKALRGSAANEEVQAVALAIDPRLGELPGSIRSTCPNIQWLDLSMSLLPDWDQVATIAAELDRLDCLILNFVRLAPVPRPSPPTRWAAAFASIKDLRLDGTMIAWDEMLALAPALPSLELLQLGQNRLTSLAASRGDSATPTDGAGRLPNLHTLILEDNLLCSWDDVVAALAPLPALENLYLTRNLIAAIPRYKAGPVLRRLKHVGLCRNPIATWEDLDNLESWFPSDCTRAKGPASDAAGDRHQGSGFSLNLIPLNEAGDGADPAQPDRHVSPLVSSFAAHDFRAIAVARLAGLETLDRTPVTARERRDAELYVFGKVDDGSRLTTRGVAAASSLGLKAQGPLGNSQEPNGGVAVDEEAVALTMDQKRLVFPRYDELKRRFSPDAEQVASRSVERQSIEVGQSGVAEPTATTATRTASDSGAAKGTLKAKLVEVRVTRSAEEPRQNGGQEATPVAGDGGDGAARPVKLISSTPLRLAKIKLAKAVSARPTQVQSLWAVLSGADDSHHASTPGSGRLVVELDDLSKDLLWYGIGSGDEIVVIVADTAS